MSQTSPTTAAATSGSPTSGGTSASDPFASLTGNFSTFLTLLTTQLQNQDPSSPMDSSQFTTELVQFTGVEQQIDTNTSLTQLIQLAQGSAVMQSTDLLGKQVQATSTQLALQNGSASLDFNAPAAGPVGIAVYDGAGQALYSTTVNATQGSNTWTWNGQTGGGGTEPDGAYTVGVTSGSGGAASAVPFTVLGTVTGVQQKGTGVTLDLGALQIGTSALTSVH